MKNKIILTVLSAMLLTACAGVSETPAPFLTPSDEAPGEQYANAAQQQTERLAAMQTAFDAEPVFSESATEKQVAILTGEKVEVVTSGEAIQADNATNPCREGADEQEKTQCIMITADNRILAEAMVRKSQQLCRDIDTESIRSFCLSLRF